MKIGQDEYTGRLCQDINCPYILSVVKNNTEPSGCRFLRCNLGANAARCPIKCGTPYCWIKLFFNLNQILIFNLFHFLIYKDVNKLLKIKIIKKFEYLKILFNIYFYKYKKKSQYDSK